MSDSNKIDKIDVMVVAPHPDDAEFAIAGTAVKWVKEGKKVVFVVCTSGDKGTSDRTIKPKDLAKIREQEQQDAANVIGVQEVIFLRYKDQQIEDTGSFRRKLVRLIRMYRPDTVVTDDPYRRYRYWHRDHRVVARVTLDAVFPYARDHLSYPDLLGSGLEPHKVKEILLFNTDEPNVRFDITDSFNLKLAALRCHMSQVGQRDPAQLENMLRKRAMDMAQGSDFELAEAFHRIEMW